MCNPHRRVAWPAAVTAGRALVAVVFAVPSMGRAQPGPAVDPYSILAVRWDLPKTIRIGYAHVHPRLRPSVYQFWYGRLRSKKLLASTAYWYLAKPKVSDETRCKVLAREQILIGIDILDSVPPQPDWLARRAATSQAITVNGSFSGKRIGDECRVVPHWARSITTRTGPANRPKTSIFWQMSVRRGPVVLWISGSNEQRDDWSREIERCAISLVDRIDAVKTLASSGKMPVPVGRRQISARSPNGVAVAHLKEFADAVGAKSEVDFAAGTAAITANGHTLLLHIGRKEAWIDGRPMTLPFPALRHGPHQVWCPVDTLRRLGFQIGV